MYQLKLVLRSLFYRRNQYTALFFVCVVGVAISLACISISTGMIAALNSKAAVYYGGDLVFMEARFDDGIGIYGYEDYIEKLQKVFGDDAIIAPRIDYDARHVRYFFEGVQALQKTIKGVNFETEAQLFDKMKFVSGGIEKMTSGSNGVIISEPIAKKLNVRLGDLITLQFRNNLDYIDTVDLVVQGIFQDSSAFGTYTSYMDFRFLQVLREEDSHFANRICIDFPNRKLSKRKIEDYQKKLEQIFNMFPLVDDKNLFLENQYDYEVPTAVLIPLSANLTDTKVLEVAMDAVISFVILMLVVIIVAGIGSTYRILIMKRINEIGIYMAIGMKKGAIFATLLWESLILLVSGCIGGLIFSLFICKILSMIDFSFIPSFNLFLIRGNLSPTMDVIKSVTVILTVIIVTLAAVLYAVWKSIKIMPVKALAVTE